MEGGAKGTHNRRVHTLLWVLTYMDHAHCSTPPPIFPIFPSSSQVPQAPLRAAMRIFLSALGVLWYRRALDEGAERDHTVRARITAVLRAGGKVLVFAEGTTKREGPPGTMYGGKHKRGSGVVKLLFPSTHSISALAQ